MEKKKFNSGDSKRTAGLFFSFPEEDGTFVAVLDTLGSSEAITVTAPKLVEKTPGANQEKTRDAVKTKLKMNPCRDTRSLKTMQRCCRI